MTAEHRIEKYAHQGARHVRNLVFAEHAEPSPCVPHQQVRKSPSALARDGVLKSSTGAIEPRHCKLEPLIVEFTTSAHNKWSPTVSTELMWVAPKTGSIFTDDGRPLSSNSSLFVEWV